MVVHDITCVVLAVRAPGGVRAGSAFVLRLGFRFHIQQVGRGAGQFTIADGQADFVLLSRCRLWRLEGHHRFVLTGHGLAILGTPGVGQLVTVGVSGAFRAQGNLRTRFNRPDWARNLRHRGVIHGSRFNRGGIFRWRRIRWRRGVCRGFVFPWGHG